MKDSMPQMLPYLSIKVSILNFSPAASEGADMMSNLFLLSFFPVLLFSLSDSQLRTTELIPSHPNNNPGANVLLSELLTSDWIDKVTCPSFNSISSQLEENRTLIFLLLFILCMNASSNFDLGKNIFSFLLLLFINWTPFSATAPYKWNQMKSRRHIEQKMKLNGQIDIKTDSLRGTYLCNTILFYFIQFFWYHSAWFAHLLERRQWILVLLNQAHHCLEYFQSYLISLTFGSILCFHQNLTGQKEI